MKNILMFTEMEKFTQFAPSLITPTFGALALILALCLPVSALAQGDSAQGQPQDQQRFEQVERGQGEAGQYGADESGDQGGEEDEGSFIGTDEEGDAVMHTKPRPRSGGVGHYEDGLIIAPQIEPIIPLPPRPRDPINPYPGPGPHPGPRPRDGINQMHEYNYNPEYPMEVPRRPGGRHP